MSEKMVGKDSRKQNTQIQAIQKKSINSLEQNNITQLQQQVGNKRMYQLMKNMQGDSSNEVIQGFGFSDITNYVTKMLSDLFSIDFSDVDIDLTEEDIMLDLERDENVDLDELNKESLEEGGDLSKIIDEALKEYRFEDHLKELEYGESAQSSHADIANNKVVIDPEKNKNDVFRKSIILHEIIHFVSNRKYGINEPDKNTAENFHNLDEGQADFGKLQEKFLEMGTALEQEKVLFSSVEAEGNMYSDVNDLYNYLKKRLEYAGVNAHQESDTVSSELYYLLNMMGKNQPAILSSKTYKMIKELAVERYDNRQKG